MHRVSLRCYERPQWRSLICPLALEGKCVPREPDLDIEDFLPLSFEPVVGCLLQAIFEPGFRIV